MRGRNRFILITMALACVVALGAVMLTGGDGARPIAAGRKMPQSLRQLCLIYQEENVTRLSQLLPKAGELVAAATDDPEKAERRMMLGQILGVAGDDGVSEVPAGKAEFVKSKARPIDRLIDPLIQKRWQSPSFDVVRGTITASSDPRALASPYLKVRRSWQQDGRWKAFCEFAAYKAIEIAAEPQVEYLSLLPAPELENDLGSASTGATRLRVGSGGDWDRTKGYTGQGVIVGDVDSGVDWSHGDFLNPDGTSRILYLWDAEDASDIDNPEALLGMTGFNYGRVWTKEQIDNGECTVLDDVADYCHGTHTLGTAAGNGGATGNYTGMAPNAGIICVKGLDPSGDEFVFEMARRLGRPAACNNSWGISWATNGPRSGLVYLFPGDGSDDYSQYFNYLRGAYPESAVIVKSAGNNGMWPSFTDYYPGGYPTAYYGSRHFGGTTTQATPISHVYHRITHNYGYGKYREYSDMMIRSDVPVSVRVVLVGGTVCTMNTGGSGAIPGASAVGTSTYYNLNQGQDVYNGEYMGYMRFDTQSTNQTRHWANGDWTIEVTPLNAGDTAHYDVWLYSEMGWLLSPSSYTRWYDSCFTTNSSHDEYQLDWAASPDVLTIGAWTTRNQWEAADGYVYHYYQSPDLNRITYFSSPGPTRDGRMKPDLAAPGAVIISTLAHNYDPGASSTDPDLRHQVMSGTSMAAPHVTGASALVLQKLPGANLNQVRRLLQGWARNDAYTREFGANAFGAGKLFILPLNEPPVAVVSVDKPELVLENKEKATFDGSHSYDREDFKLTYTWSLVSKPSGASATLSPSGKTAVLNPDPAAEGTYQVGLVVYDGIYSSEMAVTSVVVRSFAVQPPANAALQRLENDFIFYKEYVNKLTWTANPENKVALSAYKVYRKAKGAADSAYALLATLAPTTTLYEDKGLAASALYTYRITALDSKGNESDPVVVSN